MQHLVGLNSLLSQKLSQRQSPLAQAEAKIKPQRHIAKWGRVCSVSLATVMGVLIGIMLGIFGVSSSAQAASVSVSNYPLYLLSNEVTKGAPAAHRLLEPGDVGHHGSLSPSDMKSIQDSKFVVWFGAPLERNLADTLTQAPNAIALLDFKAFNRYPLRDVTGQSIKGTLDPHIWLDPENAKAITRALAVIHSHANPKYANLYQRNAKAFAKRMDAMVRATQSRYKFGPDTAPKYWAYHDAYQYLEPALKVKLAGTLTTDHHLPPKASQFRWLQQHRPNATMCLVSQGKVTSGIRKKLDPVSSTIQVEDMSQTKDFISGWRHMADDILHCIGAHNR